jgi:drug/metabolite transporter (DMT)-like permease
LAVSSASIFIRYAQADGAPSLVIAAYRLTMAALILLPIVLWRHRDELRRLTRRDLLMVSASGAFLGAHFGTWISSLAYTTVANSVVLVSTAPLFVALIAALFLRERLTRPVQIGLAVALMGSVIVGVSDACRPQTGCPPPGEFLRGEDFLGDMLALAGAVTVAAYLIIGRSVRARMSLLVYIFLTYGSAALVLCASVLIGGLPLTGFAPQAFVWLILLALVPQLIGHSSYNWALKYLPATFVSVTVLGEPIGSTALAILLLGERPTALKIIGGVLILSGIFIAAWRASEKSAAVSL